MLLRRGAVVPHRVHPLRRLPNHAMRCPTPLAQTGRDPRATIAQCSHTEAEWPSAGVPHDPITRLDGGSCSECFPCSVYTGAPRSPCKAAVASRFDHGAWCCNTARFTRTMDDNGQPTGFAADANACPNYTPPAPYPPLDQCSYESEIAPLVRPLSYR